MAVDKNTALEIIKIISVDMYHMAKKDPKTWSDTIKAIDEIIIDAYNEGIDFAVKKWGPTNG